MQEFHSNILNKKREVNEIFIQKMSYLEKKRSSIHLNKYKREAFL